MLFRSIKVNPKDAKRFSVRIRVPDRSHSSLYQATPEVGGLTSLSVNGSAVKPVFEKGYAVITRTWKAGDRIDLELPMKVQRVQASQKIAADRGKMALRYGPLMYNIEKVDQDITKPLAPDSAFSTEWRGDLLGGVMVIKGKFADGSPMMAIPNYARTNRDPAVAPAVSPGDRPPREITSVVWMNGG